MSSIEKITTFARLECGWPRTDRWNQHTDARHTRPWLLDLLFRSYLISLFSLSLLLLPFLFIAVLLHFAKKSAAQMSPAVWHRFPLETSIQLR